MILVATPQAIQYPYSPTPSVTSVSSHTSSVWSVQSSASSNATSVASATIDTFSAPPTAALPPLPSQSILPPELLRRSTGLTPRGSIDPHGVRHPHPSAPPAAEPLPVEQRQHPRRTNRLVEGNSQPCPASESCGLPPVPSLQRQTDRKVNFVENLVDSAAQIVETIWQPSKHMASQAGPKDIVLPLRTFIQETLRRSRTSYSTLQVALYYLIVIRPQLPGFEYDTNSLSQEEIQLVRAKQCGRRMFLAALILASKYLQDRNYSARAWSKISGLNTQEININEMAFLQAVDWKLHISEVVFQKWTDLVLKYTTAPSPSPRLDDEERKREWCDLILRLSPDLCEVHPPCADSATLDFEPAARGPSPPCLRTVPAPVPAPRFLEPNLAIPVPAPLRRPSAQLSLGVAAPAASADTTTPKQAMASVARALTSCPQDSFPSAPPRRYRTEICERRSSLATCMSASSPPVTPRPTTLQRTVVVDPATEAAWTLNLLREAEGTPLSRKRPAPRDIVSSGVTPRLMGLGGFGSPVLGSPVSSERGGKRVRCGGEIGFEIGVGVAQGVR